MKNEAELRTGSFVLQCVGVLGQHVRYCLESFVMLGVRTTAIACMHKQADHMLVKMNADLALVMVPRLSNLTC